ncbi:MAG: amino acid adenylation domain-containing protein, partial [Gemmatimonadetes bacterium]|nr:amino acid adenylation domain-containing protein [Gemmatimonadota bacterium]
FSLRGPVDAAALREAWQRVVDREPVLRTAFAWEGLERPLQVVRSRAPLPWEEHDWRGEPPEGRGERLEAYLEGERERGFDPMRPPLMRVALLRVADDAWELVWSYHHLLLDGWSISLLLQEVFALYEARLGHRVPVPARRRPFRDYVAWLLRQDPSRAEAFWRGVLEGFPRPTPLGVDRGEAREEDGFGTAERHLSAAATEALHAFAQRHRVTPNTLVQGAWGLLLSRYSGEEDVVFGAAVSGRPPELAGMDEMVGLFINTLPVRVRVEGEARVEGWLAALQRRQVTAREHEHTPLSQVQRWSEVPAGLPLFESLVAFENHPVREVVGEDAQGFRVEAWRGTGRSHYPLAVTVLPGDRMKLKLDHRRGRIGEDAAERMADHLLRLMEGMAAHPERRLSELELLGEAERRQVLEEWNRTATEYPRDLYVHRLFEAQAERTPDAVALAAGGERLTYAELNRRANRLAHHLRGLGVGPEARVAVCLERGPELVVSVLGVLKAGGAYVPLDPDLPVERLAWMIADAGVPVLVTRERLHAALPPHPAATLRVDTQAERIAAEREDDPAGGAGSGNAAYVIYTSGSTGRPKGVLVEHGSLANLVAWHRRTFSVSPDDRATLLAGIGFDASVWELWPYLASGARVHLPAEEVRTSPPLLRDWLVGERITLAFLPTPLAEAVLSLEWPAETALRRLLTGGDRLLRFPPSSLPFEVVNHYGPTETTVVVTSGPVPTGSDAVGAPSIGSAIDNTRLYVLDARLQPVPVGVAGELYVGGAGVARGYLDRPELTAERFVPDPFGGPGAAGARMYRTGDRVRRLPTGELEFVGRIDGQVKIRGFRIETGEVEAVLAGHPAVRECAVMAREDAPGSARLVAYVVGSVEEEALRAWLRRSLPEYMVPGVFVSLERMPLTPNGKLDRRALPAPEHAPGEGRHQAPRTPVEEALAGIWAEVLGVERVGVRDSFFALGGHSLLAIGVVSRVQAALGVELPLRALFEAPTVAELAERVEALRRAELPVLPPVVPVERTGELPLSFAQERLWFLDRLEPESVLYNIPAALRLSGALDMAALERALGEIVRRHEALRTTFGEREGAPVQVVVPFGGFALPVADLSALGEAEREAETRRRAAEEAARSFDLATGPVFRATLLRLGGAEHVLLLGVHHVAGDEWSVGVLFHELSALYAAYREGRESPLPELAVQYADYAVWQREQLRGEVLDRELAWWKERLAGAPERLELPTDRPRSAVQTHRGAEERMDLSAALSERLHALGRGEGATLFMTLLAAWQVLLAKYAGSEDVVVGTPIAGRTRGEVEGLIGFFVNTLVLRTDLSGDPDFRETLRRVRETTLGAYEHQELPFERLVEELRPERDLGHSPLFQVLFTVRSDESLPADLTGVRMEALEPESTTAKFDLSLTLAPRADGLRAVLSYATDLFERGTVRRMLDHFARVLEQVAADADVRLSELELLGEEERRVLERWNRTDAGYPRDLCVHQLVQAQAERTPEAVALVSGSERLSYGELERRANRLAHHLRRHGMGPESRVGVCLERTPGLVVALLAVLKAGAAYVPLDPAYPRERLGWMIEDAGVVLVLTSRALEGVLPEGTRTLALDTLDATVEAEPDRAPESGVQPENLSHVIFTSGSTGRPKGVMIRHASTVVLLHWLRENVTDEERSAVLFSTSINFDVSVAEIFGTLAWGGTLHLAENALSLARMHEAGIVYASMVPTAAAELLRAGAIPASVRTLNLGGEPLPNDLAQALYATGTVQKVGNLYGPTEDTTYSTYSLVERGGAQVSVGRPIANTRAYVLDGSLQPVPVGVVGELYLAGDGLARGYANRPDLTAERFLPNPFGEPGSRMYRVMDRVRWNPAGELEYFGRTDFQVKVRGFRIELGEIETALRTHPEVREAVATVREDAPGDRRLVAYVVAAESGTAPAAAELRTHLRERLPEYMVPAAFVTLDELPRTGSGKLDRRALPAPEHAPAEEQASPRTPAEEILAGIYAEVLGVAAVGIHDDFFALGGHSLLATRLASRVGRAFATELPLRVLFEAPTVAELAGRVEALRRAELPPLPPVVPVERTGTERLPLSFAQERLWFLDRLQPGSAFYNVPMAVRLSGTLDTAALERALGEIVRRHEVLRTVFPQRAGEPALEVVPFGGFALPVADLAGVDAAAREAEVERRAAEDAAGPFDLSAGPLFRVELLRLAEREHVLLACMHHVVAD